MTVVKMHGTAAKQKSSVHWSRIWKMYGKLSKSQYHSQCSCCLSTSHSSLKSSIQKFHTKKVSGITNGENAFWGKKVADLIQNSKFLDRYL